MTDKPARLRATATAPHPAARKPVWLPSLRTYQPAWAWPDLSAGMAIAAVGLPSAIAYPAIAGLPPETGLKASIGSLIGYALLGPSRRLIVGPDAATMAVLAAVLAGIVQQMPALTLAERAAGAPVISLMVAAICFAAGFLKLGNLANLLSRPILAGFFIGVAISIIVGQIGHVTGLQIDGEGLTGPLLELATGLSQIHWPSFALALAMFAILQAVRIWPVPVPGPVIVIVLSGALSALLRFEAMGITVVGDLPGGLLSMRLPALAELPLGSLLMGSAAVFVVSFGAGIITARSFAAQSGDEVDPNSELRGFAAANLMSGLMGGFPVTSSDSRTAVNMSVGGKSQVAGLCAGAALIIAVLFFSDALRVLPMPALGAILISAAISVIDTRGLRQIWRISRIEFGFALIAMAGAVGYGVMQGVIIALLATFVYVTLNAMQPKVVLLGRIPGRRGFYKLHRSTSIKPLDGMTIGFIQGSVLFFNAEFVKAQLGEIIEGLPADTRWLVIDASAITQLDSTGAAMLAEIWAGLEARHVRLGFADVQSDVAALMARAGIADRVGRAMFFDDPDDAVRAFDLSKTAPPA